MRNVTSENITETFLGYFGEDTDPRLHEIMTSLATHLHAFIKESKLTHNEWREALHLLQWTGEITTPERNEFVLLSDVLGVSSLVDMINSNSETTSSSVLGPFHISDAPPMALGADFKRHYEGEVVLVEGCIKAIDGTPIAGAKIDIWQTAPNGKYSSQDEEQGINSFHGIFTSDENGCYRFTTVKPVEYTVPADGPVGRLLDATGRHPWRPSHLHYIVSAGGYNDLVTEVFPDDDPYLDQDTVFGVRDDLVVKYEEMYSGSFPAEGFELSGKVSGGYLRFYFDVILDRTD